MESNKKLVCKNCGFENIEGTNYCQKCGKKLRRNFIKQLNFGLVSGMNLKGVSIAPLVSKTIKSQADEIKVNKKQRVKVIPLKNGSWYCPDCGQLNKAHSLYCKSCGRDL